MAQRHKSLLPNGKPDFSENIQQHSGHSQGQLEKERKAAGLSLLRRTAEIRCYCRMIHAWVERKSQAQSLALVSRLALNVLKGAEIQSSMVEWLTSTFSDPIITCLASRESSATV